MSYKIKMILGSLKFVLYKDWLLDSHFKEGDRQMKVR